MPISAPGAAVVLGVAILAYRSTDSLAASRHKAPVSRIQGGFWSVRRAWRAVYAPPEKSKAADRPSSIEDNITVASFYGLYPI